MRRLLITSWLILSAVLACNGDSTGPDLDVARVVVEPDSVLLEAGEVQQYRAFAIKLNGDTIRDVRFEWSSSDTSLAEVNQSGIATALWEGKVSIIAEASGVSGSGVLAVARQELIAFSSNRSINSDIYLIRPDGSGLRRVTTDASVDEHPDWSHDGKIAFSHRTPDFETLIYSVNMDGSEVTNLTPGFHWAVDPSWSPDGERIVFAGAQDESDPVEILVMHLATGELTRITYEGVPWARYDRAPAKPRWSPDAARIVYETFSGGDWDIYSVNADGTNPVNLTDHPAEDREPAWSPDGSKIAFASNRSASRDGDMDIWVMNADGSGLVRLTSTSSREAQPDWSPDGSKLVFVFNRDFGSYGGYGELYLINADGSNPTAVTQGSVSSNSWPRWRRR